MEVRNSSDNDPSSTEGGLIMCPSTSNKTTKPSVTMVTRERPGTRGRPTSRTGVPFRSIVLCPLLRSKKKIGRPPRSRRRPPPFRRGWRSPPSARRDGKRRPSRSSPAPTPTAVQRPPEGDDARERRKERCGGATNRGGRHRQETRSRGGRSFYGPRGALGAEDG
jgi:hypothetical protein